MLYLRRTVGRAHAAQPTATRPAQGPRQLPPATSAPLGSAAAATMGVLAMGQVRGGAEQTAHDMYRETAADITGGADATVPLRPAAARAGPPQVSGSRAPGAAPQPQPGRQQQRAAAAGDAFAATRAPAQSSGQHGSRPQTQGARAGLHRQGPHAGRVSVPPSAGLHGGKGSAQKSPAKPAPEPLTGPQLTAARATAEGKRPDFPNSVRQVLQGVLGAGHQINGDDIADLVDKSEVHVTAYVERLLRGRPGGWGVSSCFYTRVLARNDCCIRHVLSASLSCK